MIRAASASRPRGHRLRQFGPHRALLGPLGHGGELGFVRDGKLDGYSHADGRQVVRWDGLFPWVLAVGDRRHPIWCASTSLDSSSGLEIPAEVRKASEAVDALLLEPAGAGYREHRFVDLRKAAQVGPLEVFPAIFRLRRRTGDA